MKKKQRTPATYEEAKKILGPSADDEVINDILKTGATSAEILEANHWYDEEEYLAAELERKLSPRIKDICDILAEEQGRIEDME